MVSFVNTSRVQNRFSLFYLTPAENYTNIYVSNLKNQLNYIKINVWKDEENNNRINNNNNKEMKMWVYWKRVFTGIVRTRKGRE